MFLKEYNKIDICLENYIYLEEGFNLNSFLEDYIRKLENIKIDKTYISKQKIKYNKLLNNFKSKLSKEEENILNNKTKEIEDNFKDIDKEGLVNTTNNSMFLSNSYIKIKIEQIKSIITKCFLTFDDNILKGASIYLVVYIIQSIIGMGLVALFGSVLGFTLSMILVTPIIEELGRYVALKTDSIDSYSSTLNIAELSVLGLSKFNSNIIVGLVSTIIRIIVASELHIRNKERMKNALENEQIKTTIVSIIYHMLWNSMGAILGVLALPINVVGGKTIFKQ